MIPQSCSDIHYSLIESNKNNFIFNNVCCFDYLINIEEYYRDNMSEIYFYKKFIKLIYELDKQSFLDFQNYNKNSLVKFIFILNKASCYFYTHKKIKFSKFLCNLSVKISQIIFKSDSENNTDNEYENNGHTLEEIKDKNLISNIYNNACCNYLQTFSYNKCLKFLEYSFKNIEENDINDKLIYYNNLLIVKAKNIIKYDNINSSMKTLEELIKSRKEYFNNLYSDNSNFNNGENSEKISAKLKSNEANHNSFKLLCFIINNYILFVEKILKQKEEAKNLYRKNYDYICSFLGKESFEAQKFLIRLNDDIENKNLNFKLDEGSKIIADKDNINLKLKSSIIKNPKPSERDLNKRLNNIIEKIEEFEGILQNEKILNMLKEKNSHRGKSNKDSNKSIELNNNKDDININNINKDDIKKNESIIKTNEQNSPPQKKEKEKITFDMMDNFVEEFKKENNEKSELNQKLKEEKEKKEKEEKQKQNEIKKNTEINANTQNKENKNENQAPKKVPRIKKLFQKVLGTTHKEPKQTKLGGLFQSLMGGIKEEKNDGNNPPQIFEEKKDEIKVQKEKDDNFINLDDDDDKDNNSINDNEKINNKEENKNEINENKNNNQSSGFGFTIKVNLDPSSYNYDATTLYQKNEN